MKTSTFYPAGTECYRDPTQGSCFSFGNSGSGALRKTTIDGEERFSFAGPLSMTKSCDSVFIFDNQISYSSANPGIFTDAHCYLPWIAAAYGMKLPEGFTYKTSCGESKGQRDVIDEAVCWGQDAESLRRSRCKNWQLADNATDNNATDNNATVNNLWPGYATEYDCQQYILSNGTSKAPAAPAEANRERRCDFENQRYTKNGWDMPWDKCMLEAREGYAYNIYMCKVNN